MHAAPAISAGKAPRPALDGRRRDAKRYAATLASLEAELGRAAAPGEIADLGRRLQAVNDELRALEERWLDLSSQLETSAA